MAAKADIYTTHKGEGMRITLEAKNPDGTALVSPEAQTVTIAIGHRQGSPEFLEKDFTMIDAGSSIFQCDLSAGEMSMMNHGQEYAHTIWSKYLSNDPLAQAAGAVRLAASVEMRS